MTKRKGRMLVSGRSSMPLVGLHWGGCSCHNTRQARRLARKSVKRREQREEKKIQELAY